MNQHSNYKIKTWYIQIYRGPFRGSVHYGWGERQQTVSVYVLFLPSFVQRMGI